MPSLRDVYPKYYDDITNVEGKTQKMNIHFKHEHFNPFMYNDEKWSHML